MRFFQGSLFSEIGVSEYAESIGEELQFDAAGHPIAVGLPRCPGSTTVSARKPPFACWTIPVPWCSLRSAGAPATHGHRRGTRSRVITTSSSNETASSCMARRSPLRHEGRTWYVQFAASERLSEMLRSYVGRPVVLPQRCHFLLRLAAACIAVVMRFTLRAILKPLNEASAIAAKISPQQPGRASASPGSARGAAAAGGELQRRARSPRAQLPPAAGVPGIRRA